MKINWLFPLKVYPFTLDQQNRALEAATVTLRYFTALCLPMGKHKKYLIFIFSQDQESSRQITVLSQK